MSAIAISVNGETRQMPQGATVAALLAAIGLDTRKVAVERNEEIVPRSTYASVALHEGDKLEIGQVIGGGLACLTRMMIAGRSPASASNPA